MNHYPMTAFWKVYKNNVWLGWAMELQRLEILEKDMQLVKEDIVTIKVGQASTDGKLNSIEEKLDRVIQIETQREQRFQEKVVCEMARVNIKEDIDGLGDKCRDTNKQFSEHEKMHFRKADRYATWITTALLSFFVIAKLAKLL